MNSKPTFIQRLQTKWNVGSPVQVILILVVFSLTGSSVVALKKPLFELLHVTPAQPMWFKVIMYLLFVFPMYQALLLFYGFLFGQFRFFWEKEKRMLRLMARPFRR